MNRASKLAGLSVLAVCLGGVFSAQAQDGAQQQNLSSAAQPAYEALSAGRRAKDDGDLAEAERKFRRVLDLSQSGSEQYQAAVEELSFHLPFLRAEGYVRAEDWLKAERLLEDLLQQHQDDTRKTEELVQLIALLRDRARPRAEDRQPGRKVIHYVENKLDVFLRENGRYPRAYDELNRLLAVEGSPLDDYEIVHYAVRGGAYGLTLRGGNNPDNVLTVQRTGLVE